MWCTPVKFTTLGNGASDNVNFVGVDGTAKVGDGAGDTVFVGLAYENTVTVGNGNDDVVNLDTAGGNTITVGNGYGDVVNVTNGQGGNTITLGNGNGDVVNDFGNGDTIKSATATTRCSEGKRLHHQSETEITSSSQLQATYGQLEKARTPSRSIRVSVTTPLRTSIRPETYCNSMLPCL